MIGHLLLREGKEHCAIFSELLCFVCLGLGWVIFKKLKEKLPTWQDTITIKIIIVHLFLQHTSNPSIKDSGSQTLLHSRITWRTFFLKKKPTSQLIPDSNEVR